MEEKVSKQNSRQYPHHVGSQTSYYGVAGIGYFYRAKIDCKYIECGVSGALNDA